MSEVIISGVRLAAYESGAAWDVRVADGEVDSVAPAGSLVGGEARDGSGLMLYPGFVDVHNHGAVGVDVNEADVDGLVAVAKFLAGEGVTAWVPTLVPDSDENYRRVIDSIDLLMEIQLNLPIAQAVGVHYEGVFANEKMCGALRPEYYKRFTGKEVDELPRLSRGVHMTTFA